MNAKRIAELKKRAEAGLKNCSFDDSRQFYTDLLALLADYQAVLPLLEEIGQAGMISNTKKCPGNYLHFIETDAEKILGSAMTWKNRPGAYKERSQPHE